MSVNGWVSRGGAELGTNRFVPSGDDVAAIASQLEAHQIDGLLMVGGWSGYVSAYELASRASEYPALAIPIVWGSDAVHGHGNVIGATLFPHNIGLGAANDPQLIRRIGEATGREVAVTGLDWTFGPTVAVHCGQKMIRPRRLGDE